jgi:hypothetical protein
MSRLLPLTESQIFLPLLRHKWDQRWLLRRKWGNTAGWQIYLPLLWDAAECCAWPLPLSFHQGHFCALALLHNHSKLDGTP